MKEGTVPVQRLSVKLRADGVLRIRQAPVSARRGSAGRGFLDSKCKVQDWQELERRKGAPAKQAKPGFGALPQRETRFGKRGRDTLTELGALIDERFGKNAVFCTLTIPGTGEAQYKAVASYSGYIVSLVCQWFRDRLGECHYGWCWEWQKRGALHLHCVVASADSSALDGVLVGWKEQCRAVLQAVSEKSGVNIFENTETGQDWSTSDVIQMDAQKIQKSACNYLAKYLGKRKEPGLRQHFYPPVRWWSVNNRALFEIRQRRRVCVLESVRRDVIERATGAIVAAVQTEGVKMVAYSNRVFPWLQNVVALPDNWRKRREIWARVSSAVRELMAGALCGKNADCWCSYCATLEGTTSGAAVFLA